MWQREIWVRRCSDGRHEVMLPSVDVGNAAIVSARPRHTIDPVTVQRFASSLSRSRVPRSSAQALLTKKSVSAAPLCSAGTKYFRSSDKILQNHQRSRPPGRVVQAARLARCLHLYLRSSEPRYSSSASYAATRRGRRRQLAVALRRHRRGRADAGAGDFRHEGLQDCHVFACSVPVAVGFGAEGSRRASAHEPPWGPHGGRFAPVGPHGGLWGAKVPQRRLAVGLQRRMVSAEVK